MVGEIDAARYLISLDPERKYFNKELTYTTTVPLYEGNARLNKIMHLAQNMYIGRTGHKLIDSDTYAYDNGAVFLEVQENYAMLLGTMKKTSFTVDPASRDFLRRVYEMLKDAPIDELVQIDHEDPAWIEKHAGYYKWDQKMDPMKYAEEYKERYEGANLFLDRMVP